MMLVCLLLARIIPKWIWGRVRYNSLDPGRGSWYQIIISFNNYVFLSFLVCSLKLSTLLNHRNRILELKSQKSFGKVLIKHFSLCFFLRYDCRFKNCWFCCRVRATILSSTAKSMMFLWILNSISFREPASTKLKCKLNCKQNNETTSSKSTKLKKEWIIAGQVLSQRTSYKWENCMTSFEEKHELNSVRSSSLKSKNTCFKAIISARLTMKLLLISINNYYSFNNNISNWFMVKFHFYCFMAPLFCTKWDW